ncbi:MAG: hypothetical protein ACR2N3_09870 [Pyrinomonadaceae bacterium]
MKKFILLLFFAALSSVNVFAQQPFKLVSSEQKTIKLDDLTAIEKTRTVGKKENSNLIFTEKEIRLVVETGPEDDMFSYRISGMRNPNLIVPSGATLKILFVNSDEDMKHDIRFGHIAGEWTIAPEITETVGSNRLEHKAEDGSMQAEEIVVKAGEDGAYKYFCSVRGHAKGGMWGNILVGITSTENLKTPEKTTHVHSPDEEMQMDKKKPDDEMSGMKMDDKKSGEMPAMKVDAQKTDEMAGMNHSGKQGMSGMTGMNHGAMQMNSVTNLGDPMTRESSGTAWIPDSSPMYARMKMLDGGGMLMLMGSAFARYTKIGSDRDVSIAGKGSRNRFDAPSMFMAMYSKPLSEKSQFGFRAMMSLDPIIERGYGYPLLYQSGETFRGLPIHDRQHPHDFISELAVTFSHKFNDKNSVYFYAGYPGEPALGPPTFMHRLSAMNNPDAPISHHWQDSTHITWGVLTAGYSFGKFKFETSVFKGQEPDENRWNFDRPKLDSVSGRFSFNPNKNWAFQVSYGYLKNPEPAEPDLKIRRRVTASAIYNKNFGDDKTLASAFVWGQNDDNGERTNAFLFESNFDFGKNAVFGRVERVQKSGHELILNPPDEDKIFNVGAYSIGYLRDIVKDKGIDVGLGGMLTFNQNPAALIPYYGGTNHQGFQVFLRFRPSRMNH